MSCCFSPEQFVFHLKTFVWFSPEDFGPKFLVWFQWTFDDLIAVGFSGQNSAPVESPPRRFSMNWISSRVIDAITNEFYKIN